MELTAEIAAIRGGAGDSGRLLGEFRRAVLLVPLADGPDGGLMSAVSGGIRWIYAFTDEEALARFAAARGEADAGREWEYLSVLGARLVDAVVPAADGPAGVAVNVADEDGSMFFPPVVGIVPDGSAVDLDRGEVA
ncbi:SseB family protein [Streptomyces sp. NPDC006450]|uniref:SseB family protein n=1 Tax=Streptomyces sp. NPDC006450 TaxID=3155458 RepID=UPI0033B86415